MDVLNAIQHIIYICQMNYLYTFIMWTPKTIDKEILYLYVLHGTYNFMYMLEY